MIQPAGRLSSRLGETKLGFPMAGSSFALQVTAWLSKSIAATAPSARCTFSGNFNVLMRTTETGKATLHMLCGKIAAGKSTLAAELAERHGALLVSEDFWTSRLFGPEMREVADYVRFSRRLREAMGPHLTELLRAGLSIVLDFPANTHASRAWMKGIYEAAGTDHILQFLDQPDEICRARLRERNAAGEHEFAATDAQFDVITSYFEPPTEDEGLNIVAYR